MKYYIEYKLNNNRELCEIVTITCKVVKIHDIPIYLHRSRYLMLTVKFNTLIVSLKKKKSEIII